MAIASQPYSSLGTSSHALVWDPGDPGSAVQCSCRPHAARVVSLGRINCACVCCCTWCYTIKWFLRPYGPIFGTSPHCDRRLRSWNSRYLYQNAFIACCGTDCQPHIRLFACSAWLLMPPPHHSIDIVPSQPPTLTPAHCRTLITLNLRCNYQKSPLLHKQFSHLSFLYA